MEVFPTTTIGADGTSGIPIKISADPSVDKYYYNLNNKQFYKYNGTDWKDINPASSIVQFNAYYAPTDPISGEYVRKLLIFPDKKSMDFKVTANDFPISDLDVITKALYGSSKYIAYNTRPSVLLAEHNRQTYL